MNIRHTPNRFNQFFTLYAELSTFAQSLQDKISIPKDDAQRRLAMNLYFVMLRNLEAIQLLASNGMRDEIYTIQRSMLEKMLMIACSIYDYDLMLRYCKSKKAKLLNQQSDIIRAEIDSCVDGSRRQELKNELDAKQDELERLGKKARDEIRIKAIADKGRQLGWYNDCYRYLCLPTHSDPFYLMDNIIENIVDGKSILEFRPDYSKVPEQLLTTLAILIVTVEHLSNFLNLNVEAEIEKYNGRLSALFAETGISRHDSQDSAAS